MALTLQTGVAAPCSLAECLAALDETGFDPADPASLERAAHWLARLGANRDFLGNIALEELKAGCDRPGGQGYCPQVMMLGKARAGWFVRANIWPSAQEAVVRESGEAAFVYGLPHDHNFSFLTVGYHGPGYRSDHYEVDPDTIIGVAGEHVTLRFVETSLLDRGRVMLYRARRDVHCQFAPETLSVSINLMHSAAQQRWHDQYRYDLASSTIAAVLTQCTGDALARFSLALDPANGRDLLEHIAARHQIDRMRWSAIQALALSEAGNDARSEFYYRYASESSGWLQQRCTAAAIVAIAD